MILSSFAYSPLTLFLFSLFHASTFVPSPWPSQADPVAYNLLNSRQLLYSTLVWILLLILISLCSHYNLQLSLSLSISSMAPLTQLQPPLTFSVLDPEVSGDDLFSAPKTSRSFSNSDLRHLWHSLDSDHLQVLEMLWSTSYSKPLPTVPNTTACSSHYDPLPDTPSEGCSETSLDSAPSNLNSAPTFFGDSPSHSRDRAGPTV